MKLKWKSRDPILIITRIPSPKQLKETSTHQSVQAPLFISTPSITRQVPRQQLLKLQLTDHRLHWLLAREPWEIITKTRAALALPSRLTALWRWNVKRILMPLQSMPTAIEEHGIEKHTTSWRKDANSP
jgi:hypothetical protein